MIFMVSPRAALPHARHFGASIKAATEWYVTFITSDRCCPETEGIDSIHVCIIYAERRSVEIRILFRQTEPMCETIQQFGSISKDHKNEV